MKVYSVLVFVHFSVAVELDALIGPFRQMRRAAFDVLNETVESITNLELLKARGKVQLTIQKFPCDVKNGRSAKVPESVHELRPGDIDVVGGIGDSLTAGVGLLATNFMHVSLEHRGIAPTAGGKGSWRQYFTLPNVLKMFNPNLTGFATETSLTIHPESQLNIGETGASSEDTPYMAKELVRRIKADPRIDVDTHWKMITFMIGPNDFCSQICFQNNEEILEKHRRELTEVLTILKANLPRTIVNLIPPPNLKVLMEFTEKSLTCEMSHLFECPCLFGPASKNRQKIYVKLMKDWQDIDMEVGNRPEFDTDVFTVVIQPFTLNFTFPLTNLGKTDYTYYSEDCFHVSQKGNALIANSLWNNIVEPVGRKSGKIAHNIKCPSAAHPYIFTRRNSGGEITNKVR